MAYQVASNSIGTGTQYDLTNLDSLIVPAFTNVVATDAAAISGVGKGQSASVFGFVSGTYGIFFNSPDFTSATNYNINISSSGIVNAGLTAINISGANSGISNYGQIFSTYGVGIFYQNNSDSIKTGVVYNYGTIFAKTSAILVNNGGDIRIFNYGKIAARDVAIYTDSGADLLYNRGQIDGDVNLFTGADRFINRGLVNGAIILGDGDDLLDNRGGTIEGGITLGTGTDTFMPGASEENAVGGGNNDILDFSRSSGVRVSLDGSIDATGWAKDDVYSGFANIVGSNLGADTLVGDTAANMLTGGGGSDILAGQDGDDVLNGGTGNDTLTGGSGTDQLNGGAGNDILTGGIGQDRLNGGAGADKFIYASGDFGGVVPGTFELIDDFQSAEKDRIDLAAVDANTLAAKDQAFIFIGSAAFHNIAGELRFEKLGSDIVVFGDTNGDGTADIAIGLFNVASLAASDFIL